MIIFFNEAYHGFLPLNTAIHKIMDWRDDMTENHKRHYLDSYPLCWTMDRDEAFAGTYTESEVTCSDCKKIMEEE